MAQKGSRSRNYMFTINFGEGAEEFQLTPDIDGWDDWCKFAVWQIEVGAEGTPHIQGYLELRNGMSMDSLHKKKGLERAALFERRGTAIQAIAYCEKEETRVDGPWRFGVSVTVYDIAVSLLEHRALPEKSYFFCVN